MKNLFVLFFLTMFAVAGYSQSVPEKANTIVVAVSDSNAAKAKILSVLQDKDYAVSSGKNPMDISTMQKTLKNGTRVNYLFQIKGKEVIISGRLPVAGQSGTAIAYKGNKGTPMMNGFEEMDKLAKALGGSIKYEVR